MTPKYNIEVDDINALKNYLTIWIVQILKGAAVARKANAKKEIEFRALF